MAIINDNRPKITSTVEGISMTIDTTSRFVYEQYIRIYSNKLTFLREITANAFDAVVELWERDYQSTHTKQEFLMENPIVLGVYADASGQYVSIKETKGIGISPERMTEYLKITNSTKRDSKHQIGAKGIGRLSALAYQSEYYIETVYDGIKYFYMVDFYDNAPKVTKMYELPTEEPNHTKVKIYLQSDRLELTNIEAYVNKNLCYFDNLVVEQLNFKYKGNLYVDYDGYSLANRNNTGNPKQGFFVLLGSIPYEINIDHLNLKLEENDQFRNLFLSQHIIFKFSVSDLDVVASRDSLEFTDRTVKKLTEVLEKADIDIKTQINEIFFEMWETVSKENKQSLNALFRGQDIVINNVRISNDSQLKKESIRNFFKSKLYGLSGDFFKGAGKASNSHTNITSYYNYQHFNILITDRKIRVKDRANLYCLYVENMNEHQLSELVKFLPYKSSATLIEESKSESTSSTSYRDVPDSIYAYYKRTYYSPDEIRSKDLFKTIVETSKNLYCVYYNMETKANVFSLVNSLMYASKEEVTILIVKESVKNRVKNIPYITEIEFDINKIADSHLLHSIIPKDALILADCYQTYLATYETMIQKHGISDLSKFDSFYNHVKNIAELSRQLKLDFNITIKLENYNKAFFTEFVKSKVKRNSVSDKEYSFVFEHLTTTFYKNVKTSGFYYNNTSYNDYYNELEESELVVLKEVRLKLLSLYPVKNPELALEIENSYNNITL